MQAPYDSMVYSNHMMVAGPRTLGHGGWGGQYVMANLSTGIVGAFYSVMESQHALNGNYIRPVIRMLESVTSQQNER